MVTMELYQYICEIDAHGELHGLSPGHYRLSIAKPSRREESDIDHQATPSTNNTDSSDPHFAILFGISTMQEKRREYSSKNPLTKPRNTGMRDALQIADPARPSAAVKIPAFHSS